MHVIEILRLGGAVNHIVQLPYRFPRPRVSYPYGEPSGTKSEDQLPLTLPDTEKTITGMMNDRLTHRLRQRLSL